MRKLAVVVPYRDREEHLRVFLPHMKRHLDGQNIVHRIHVIEQEAGKLFNRAKLLNVGFLEADADCDYFVFHDVDMLPLHVDYSYQEDATHLAAAASQFNHALPYPGYFGGVTMLTREAMKKVNGYSNGYWGWGAEDDDLLCRCHLAGLKAQRRSPGILRSLSHDRVIDEQKYEENFGRVREMWSKKSGWENDGLNSCAYSVLVRDETPERMLIKVSI